MKTLLVWFDFLSPDESLSLNNLKLSKSYLGGLLSFWISILFGFGLIIAIKDYILEPVPLIFKDQDFENLNFMNFTNQEIQFFFKIEHNSLLKFDIEENTSYMEYFSLRTFIQEKIYDCAKEQSYENYYEDIEIVNCLKIFKNNNLSDFPFPIQNYLCIQKIKNIDNMKNYDSNIKIGKILQTQNSTNYIIEKILILELKKCQNQTNLENINFDIKSDNYNSNPIRNICKPKEEIDNLINSLEIKFHISNFIIQHNNYDSPLQKYFESFTERLYSNMLLLSELIFKKSIYSSQILFYLENFEFDFSSFESYRNNHIVNFNNGNENKNKIFKLEIRGSNQKNLFIRKYGKISDLLAKIGGMIKASYLLGFLFFNIFYKSFRIIDLIKLYHKDSLNIYLKHNYLQLKNHTMIQSKNDNHTNLNLDLKKDSVGNMMENIKFFLKKKNSRNKQNVNKIDLYPKNNLINEGFEGKENFYTCNPLNLVVEKNYIKNNPSIDISQSQNNITNLDFKTNSFNLFLKNEDNNFSENIIDNSFLNNSYKTKIYKRNIDSSLFINENNEFHKTKAKLDNINLKNNKIYIKNNESFEFLNKFSSAGRKNKFSKFIQDSNMMENNKININNNNLKNINKNNFNYKKVLINMEDQYKKSHENNSKGISTLIKTSNLNSFKQNSFNEEKALKHDMIVANNLINLQKKTINEEKKMRLSKILSPTIKIIIIKI